MLTIGYTSNDRFTGVVRFVHKSIFISGKGVQNGSNWNVNADQNVRWNLAKSRLKVATIKTAASLLVSKPNIFDS